MKLLICSVDALPRMGGVSVMAHELCNSFTSIGADVIFVGPRGTVDLPDLRRNYRLYEDFDYDRALRSGPGAEVEDARIRDLFLGIIGREKVERILLVHPFHYGIGAEAASKAAGIPLSVYFHGYEARSQIRNSYPKSLRNLIEKRTLGTLRERTFYTIGTADELLANSNYTRGLLEPFKTRPRIHVTGCGIPVHHLGRRDIDRPARSAAARASLGLAPDRIVLAFAGRLTRQKRVDRLLEIVSRHRDFHALIIGDGEMRAELDALAASLGIGDRVTFLGLVTEQAKWSGFEAADFACLLSEPEDLTGNVEGFGIALLEGAAAGAIPVSSGEGGMADVVADGVTGLVIPKEMSTDVAAERLAAAIRDPAGAARLRQAALAQVQRKYNWDSIVKKIHGRWVGSKGPDANEG